MRRSSRSARACPRCGGDTGIASNGRPGLCEPCRQGVPAGTRGLSVEYPPEPPPPLRQRMLDLFLGPVMLGLLASAAFVGFWRLARLQPQFADIYLYTAIGFMAAMYALDLYCTFRDEGGLDLAWILISDWHYYSGLLESRPRTLTLVGAVAAAAALFL